MKKVLFVMLALAMALTMMACGKKSEDAAKDRIGTAETGMEFYIATAEDGSKTVVDRSGAVAEGFTLDESGNIVDKDGRVIVAADKVQQLPTGETKPNENGEPSSGSGDSSSVPSGTGSETKSSTGSAGNGSSGSKTPSGSGSSSDNSGSSSNGDSNSGGGSGSTPTAPDPKPAHQHSWEPVYRTEIVDDYEMASVWRCNGCNADVTAILESGESMKQHFHETGNPNCMGYHSSYEQVKVGSHEEHILDHYACSCGATKAP